MNLLTPVELKHMKFKFWGNGQLEELYHMVKEIFVISDIGLNFINVPYSSTASISIGQCTISHQANNGINNTLGCCDLCGNRHISYSLNLEVIEFLYKHGGYINGINIKG